MTFFRFLNLRKRNLESYFLYHYFFPSAVHLLALFLLVSHQYFLLHPELPPLNETSRHTGGSQRMRSTTYLPTYDTRHPSTHTHAPTHPPTHTHTYTHNLLSNTYSIISLIYPCDSHFITHDSIYPSKAFPFHSRLPSPSSLSSSPFSCPGSRSDPLKSPRTHLFAVPEVVVEVSVLHIFEDHK